MKKRLLLLLMLLFALFAVIFVIPEILERESEISGTTESAQTGGKEPGTETLESRTFPYETVWTETESQTEKEPEYDPGEPVDREKIVTNLLFASDTHYMSPNLTDYGDAFHEMVDNGDGKVIQYMPQIWEAFSQEVMAAQPDALVLSGDLTLDGEKTNHLELAGRLRELEAGGVPVLVIPGNHDINNHRASAYFGSERTYVENVSPEEFLEIYGEFGYEEAAGHAPDSLSYLYILNDTTWMLMLDTCVYEPENQVYGVISEGTMEWMEQCLRDAYSQGITVIPVAHHNLQEISRVYVEECVIENHMEAMKILERYLTPAFFSGHLHVQRIMKHILEPGADSDVYGIWEVVSNSLMIPPCQYGSLTLNGDGSLSYHTKNVDVSAWAAAKGETNPELLDFAAFSDSYLRTVVKEQTYRSIEDIPDYIREIMADFYTELYQDYYAGKQVNYSEKKKEQGYIFWDRFMNPSMQFRQVEGMMRDGMAVNNQAEIPNPVWMRRE